MTELTKKCEKCEKFFEKPYVESKNAWNRRKFCSYACYWEVRKGNSKYAGFWKGKSLSEEHKAKLRKPKAKMSLEARKNMSRGRGSDSPSWQGGRTSKHEQIRKSLEYKVWREIIFTRDDFTCQHCGKRGGTIHADHIKPFATHPELRFEADNGRTLCVPCHRKTETYGINQWTKH